MNAWWTKILNKKSLCQGLSLVELMIALGLTSGLVILDLERQKNSQVTAKRQLASESRGDVENLLRGWLRQQGTIARSFGNQVDGKKAMTNSDLQQVQVFAAPPDIFQRESAVNDGFAIVSLWVEEKDISIDPVTGVRTEVTTPVEVLSQGTINGVRLMGPVEDGQVVSLDGARDGTGWVYIRTMWLEDFKEHDTRTDGAGVDKRIGSANLRVLIWQFNDLTANPSLDCATNNNCERKVASIPLELNLNGDSVDQGEFGLSCRPLADLIPIDGSARCRGNEFFRVRAWEDQRGGASYSASHQRGDCCRFVQ